MSVRVLISLRDTIFRARQGAVEIETSSSALIALAGLVESYFLENDKLKTCIMCAMNPSNEHSQFHHTLVNDLETTIRDVVCS